MMPPQSLVVCIYFFLHDRPYNKGTLIFNLIGFLPSEIGEVKYLDRMVKSGAALVTTNHARLTDYFLKILRTNLNTHFFETGECIAFCNARIIEKQNAFFL